MSTALARADAFTSEQIEIIKRDIARGASDNELQFFLAVCQRTGLDPFIRQVWCIERWTGNTRQMVTQLGIDGARLIAERSGKYEGQEGPYWCGDDGEWTDVWLSKDPPAAAKVLIYKKGGRVPTTGIALYAENVQRKRDGQPNAFWSRQPAFQLAKCAEMNGLRRSFPAELSGLSIEGESEPAAADYIETAGRVGDGATGEIRTAPASRQIEAKAEPPVVPNGKQAASQTDSAEPWKSWANGDDAVRWAADLAGVDAASMQKAYDTFKGALKPKPKGAWDVFGPWFAHVGDMVAVARAAQEPLAEAEPEVNFGMGEGVPTIHT